MRRHAFVRASWDDEVSVWYVEDSDIPGLATESETLEGLKQRVRDILPDLLDGLSEVLMKSRSISSLTVMNG
jgi:hypothetical protein